MATNDFKTFAGASGANVISQAAYQALAATSTGFQSGIAQSAQLNKVWRQSSIISSMLAQFIADTVGQNSVDDGTITTLEQNFILAIQAISRIKLTSTLNLFVAPNGNDSNSGISSSTPLLTIQAAFNLMYHNYDFGGNPGVVNVAAGTYTTPINLQGMPPGCTLLTLQGNNSNPASVIISVTSARAITAAIGCFLTVSGVQISATGTTTSFNIIGTGILSNQAWVNINSVILGSCGTSQLQASNGGILTGNSNPVTFSGTNANGIVAQTGSNLWLVNSPITFLGTPSYSSAFAIAGQCGSITITTGGTTSFTGTFTGKRYAITTTSNIFTGGGGANFFPGTIAGTADATTFGSYS